MSLPGWLTGTPIAHRGLHDAAGGRIENSKSAFEAAIKAGYAIEIDLQCTAGHDPVVFHDPAVDRLLEAEGVLADMSLDEFKALKFRESDDPMLDLRDFLDLVAARVPVVIEIKGAAAFKPAYAERITEIMRRYRGDYALMSFDPRIMKAVRDHLPDALRGLVASGFAPEDWPAMPPLMRFKLRHLYYAWHTSPHFIAYSINALPAPAPLLLKALGRPLLAWTVNSPERLAKARRFADNIIFENLVPNPRKHSHS